MSNDTNPHFLFKNFQQSDSDLAMKVTVSGSYTYVAHAIPGSNQASAVWRVKRIYDDGAGGLVQTWADGNSNFDNIATNLTSLSYS